MCVRMLAMKTTSERREAVTWTKRVRWPGERRNVTWLANMCVHRFFAIEKVYFRKYIWRRYVLSAIFDQSMQYASAYPAGTIITVGKKIGLYSVDQSHTIERSRNRRRLTLSHFECFIVKVVKEQSKDLPCRRYNSTPLYRGFNRTAAALAPL